MRVYSVRNRDGGRNLYGCLRSNDRRQLMTRSSDDDYVSSSSFGHVKVAGRFVAWEQVDTDISCKAACPPDYDATTEALFIRDDESGVVMQLAMPTNFWKQWLGKRAAPA